MMTEPDEPRFEFLMLADKAEVHRGKLYMMGGCWDRIAIPGELPAGYPLSIVLRVVLPAGEGDHVLEFTVKGPGDPTIDPRGMRFVRQGQDSRPGPVLLAFPTVLVVTQPGEHLLRATIDGSASMEIALTVDHRASP